MEQQETLKYMNLDLCENEKLAFDILFSKIDNNRNDLRNEDVKFWMYMGATNYLHPHHPNVLEFKDRLTRKTYRISYDIFDLAEKSEFFNCDLTETDEPF